MRYKRIGLRTSWKGLPCYHHVQRLKRVLISSMVMRHWSEIWHHFLSPTQGSYTVNKVRCDSCAHARLIAMNSRVVIAFVQYHADQWWSNALQQLHLHKSNANKCWHHAQLYGYLRVYCCELDFWKQCGQENNTACPNFAERRCCPLTELVNHHECCPIRIQLWDKLKSSSWYMQARHPDSRYHNHASKWLVGTPNQFLKLMFKDGDCNNENCKWCTP